MRKVRTTISIPKELRKEMEELRLKGIKINWSSIATKAFGEIIKKAKLGKLKTESELIEELTSRVMRLEGK